MDDQGEVLYFSDRKSQARPLDPFPKTEQKFHDRSGGLEVLERSISVHGKVYRIATAMAMKKSNTLLWSFFNSLLVLTPGLLMLAALAGHAISRRRLRRSRRSQTRHGRSTTTICLGGFRSRTRTTS